MFKYYSFLAISLILLSCSKDNKNEMSTPLVPSEPKGFDYWMQTGENWVYEYYLPTVPTQHQPFRANKYTIDRDTFIIEQSDTFQAKILIEEFYNPKVGIDSIFSLKKIICYYNKKDRTIKAIFSDGVEFYTDKELLVDFNEIQLNKSCFSNNVIGIDTLMISGNHFLRFKLSNGMEIVEGLTLGLLNCLPFPPDFIVSNYPYGDQQVTLYRYESDAYTYEWKK